MVGFATDNCPQGDQGIEFFTDGHVLQGQWRFQCTGHRDHGNGIARHTQFL